MNGVIEQQFREQGERVS